MLYEQSGHGNPMLQQSEDLEELNKVTHIAKIIKPNTNVYIPAVIRNCKIVSLSNSTELKQVYECSVYSLTDSNCIPTIGMAKAPVQVFVGKDDFIVTNPFDNMPAEELVKALERKGYKVSITQSIEGGIAND